MKRLKSHPSIALWAGNNENEVALVTNWWGVYQNFTLYQSDYIKLYVDTIKNELSRISPDSIYVTSSPSNGKESESVGYLASNPQSSYYGDGNKNFTVFPT